MDNRDRTLDMCDNAKLKSEKCRWENRKTPLKDHAPGTEPVVGFGNLTIRDPFRILLNIYPNRSD